VTEISENARVKVLLADFANQDPARKINLLGANWSITRIQPSEMTSPQAVVVLVDVPARFHGKDFSISVVLVDDDGNPVEVRNPTGQTEPLRLHETVRTERPTFQDVALPANTPGRVHVVLNFPFGIPLTPGQYRWRVEIDGNANPQWEADFYVAAPTSRTLDE